jgi:outer membrane protein assembly factor BamB
MQSAPAITSVLLRLARGLALVAFLAALVAPCGAAEDQTIIPPPGDYKMVEVVLDGGNPDGSNAPLVLRGGIRDGMLMIPNSLSVRIKAGELVFTTDAVKGEFGWRNPAKTQNQVPSDAVIHQYTVDATIAGGAITGTWKTADGKRTGKVSGSVKTEKELQAANAFTKGKDWPLYHGPLSSFAAAPCGLTLATDPKDFRLAWKSEDLMPCGQGNGCHYLPGMLMCRTIGGGASPVVSADGKVYVNYIQPAGTVSNIEKRYGKSANALADLEKLAAEWNSELGPGVREKFLLHADDVIVCMDAVTGKTLWKTVFAEKGRYQQGHKIGPVNNTPCLGDGKVFAMGSLGRVYALDAQTGKPLWEVPNITGVTLNSPEGLNRFHGNAPVYVDGVVVMGNQADTLHGFDANTGKELWKLPGKSRSLAVPSLWKHQGKDSIISMDGGRDASMKLFCIEPKSGKVLWETDYKGGSKGVAVSGDILVGLTFSVKGEPQKDPECVAWRMTPEKAERIWATPVKAYVELSAPAVNDRYVVVGTALGPASSTPGQMQLLDLNTGKVLATAEAPTAMNEPHIFMAENLVFVSPDGSHGNNFLSVYGATPETFKLLGSWSPPHRHTNSYHCKCMVFPVVEGRLFMRGFDGVHCYDLRKQQ